MILGTSDFMEIGGYDWLNSIVKLTTLENMVLDEV